MTRTKAFASRPSSRICQLQNFRLDILDSSALKSVSKAWCWYDDWFAVFRYTSDPKIQAHGSVSLLGWRWDPNATAPGHSLHHYEKIEESTSFLEDSSIWKPNSSSCRFHLSALGKANHRQRSYKLMLPHSKTSGKTQCWHRRTFNAVSDAPHASALWHWNSLCIFQMESTLSHITLVTLASRRPTAHSFDSKKTSTKFHSRLSNVIRCCSYLT